MVHVLATGFGEVAGAGPDVERATVAARAGGRTRMIGPNSLGDIAARAGLGVAGLAGATLAELRRLIPDADESHGRARLRGARRRPVAGPCESL